MQPAGPFGNALARPRSPAGTLDLALGDPSLSPFSGISSLPMAVPGPRRALAGPCMANGPMRGLKKRRGGRRQPAAKRRPCARPGHASHFSQDVPHTERTESNATTRRTWFWKQRVVGHSPAGRIRLLGYARRGNQQGHTRPRVSATFGRKFSSLGHGKWRSSPTRCSRTEAVANTRAYSRFHRPAGREQCRRAV